MYLKDNIYFDISHFKIIFIKKNIPSPIFIIFSLLVRKIVPIHVLLKEIGQKL